MESQNMIQKMLEENAGETSSMRVMFSVASICVLFAWIGVNIFNAIKAQGQLQLVEIPTNVLLLVGSLAAGKVTQKFAESKKNQ